MDELISEVSKQTGLPEAQALKAATTVISFLKKKLPAPIASQIDSVLRGTAPQGAGELLKKGTDLFDPE